ncbi:MAG: Rrf2 family transcriptional regulator [Oscillospiraceae bacterium]
MKISANSRYALRFLIQLSAANGRLTTMSIARVEGISEKMLERIAAKLKHAGIVRSIKGLGGGYELAFPADQIKTSDILLLMETPYLPLHCTEDYSHCQNAGDCVLLPLFQQIDSAIKSVTESVTISDLLQSKQKPYQL